MSMPRRLGKVAVRDGGGGEQVEVRGYDGGWGPPRGSWRRLRDKDFTQHVRRLHTGQSYILAVFSYATVLPGFELFRPDYFT
jgi:hypothetical protein